MHAYCCGRRTLSVELLCASIAVAVICARWSCSVRLLLWPLYALGGASVCAYCCGRHKRSVKLLCAPVVAVLRARWSCCACLILLLPSYTLSGAAVRAYCGRRTHSVELLCMPVVAIVHTWWSCCACSLLTIDGLSNGSAWESAWYPGEAHRGWLNRFLSLFFLSLVDALFLLCPWFSHEVFFTRL